MDGQQWLPARRQGIGLGISEALAKAGAIVLLADIAAEKAQAEAPETAPANLLADAYTLDVTNGRSVAAFVAAAAKLDTPVDIIVNAAGWDKVEPFLENDTRFMDRVVGINLVGPINLSRPFFRADDRAQSGKIVNISSDAGRVGSTGETVYAAPRAASSRSPNRWRARWRAIASTSTASAPARPIRRCFSISPSACARRL